MTKLLVDSNEVFTVEEAAGILKVSRMTIFRWIKAGTIIPVKLSGRTFIPKSETERLGEELG